MIHHPTKKHQQGAIGLFGILTLMMVVLFVAVVVDSGRLWMEKRKLQNIADMAAIAAGGQAGGCVQNSTNDAYKNAAQIAAEANGYRGNLRASPNEVQLGGYNTGSDGVRSFVVNNERRAVRVVATEDVPSSLFAGGIFNQRVVLRAEAVAATRNPYAAFRVGSTALAINTAESGLLNMLLGRVLQTNVALDVLSYRGLASTNITLLDLVRAGQATGLTVGSVSELLNAPVGLNHVMQLLNVAVTQDGSNASLLEGIDRGLVESALSQLLGTVNSTQIKLANVLNVSNPDSNAVAATGVNLLSLIQTAALVANGNNFINLPLGVSLPGLTEVVTRIQVIEPPQLVIGPPAGDLSSTACTIARTAQIRTESVVMVNVLLAAVDLRLRLDVGTGRAELMEIKASGSDKTEAVVNAYPGLAALRLTNSKNDQPARVNLLLGLLPLADIGLHAPIAQSAPSTMRFTVDHPVSNYLPLSMNSYSGVGNSLAGFAQEGNLVIKVLGLDLGNVLGPVVQMLILPLLATITGSVLDPLLNLLGINIAGATVILDDVSSGASQALIQ